MKKFTPEKIFDTFISYGRADSKAFATKLNEKLIAEGLNVWFDQEDIPLAVDFQEQINDGIEKAHNFLFIIAPHSVNSPYCLKEIELAIKHNKRIIPLLHVEQISQKTWQKRNPNKTEVEWQEYQTKGLHSSFPNMHPTISKINWVYFRENEDDFGTSLAGLVETIKKDADYVQQHTRYLIQGLEWERNQKQTNYLLVGEARHQASTWLTRKFDGQFPCIPTDLQCEFISESTKNANNLLTQVFLGYSENDEEIKEKIRKKLMRSGFTIWTNKTDIKTGTAFQEAINQGIEGADNLVYLLSPDSLESEYCQQELAHAFANNKRIIPLLIEEIDLELIPSQVRELQFIDLTGHEDADKYQSGVDKLLAELKKEPSYYEKQKTLLVKALKWQRQNRNPSLLLRGYNLQQFEAWLKVAKQRDDYPPLSLQEEFITASLNKSESASLEVFISYSRTDSDLARKLNDRLQELGKTTWFDQESIATGTDFQQEIYRGIESSDNFLFIISPKSVNSPYCASEVEYAQKLGKRFVTILHRKLSAKDKKNQPPALASLQYLDFNQHGGEFAANFNELVRTLDTDRDHVVNHTKWSQRALEWQEKGGEERLLRGSELAIAQNWLEEAEKNNKQPPATESQKGFIGASAELRDRLKQEREHLRKRILFGLSVALVGALGLLGFAGWQWRKAEIESIRALNKSSEALLISNQTLDARIASLQAGRKFKQLPLKSILLDADLEKQVTDGLVQTTYGGDYVLRQYNRLSSGNSVEWSRDLLDWSPDGKILAFAPGDKTVKLWQPDRTWKTLKDHSYPIEGVSWNRDGILATIDAKGNIILWDRDGNLKDSFKLPPAVKEVYGVSWSPDGQLLAVPTINNTVYVWKQSDRQWKELKANSPVFAVDWSPDGTLAAATEDGSIKLWIQDSSEPTKILPCHPDWVIGVSWSPDGTILASVTQENNIVRLYKKNGELLKLEHPNSVTSVSWSSNGILASGSGDKTIRLWKPDGTLLASLKANGSVYSLSWSPDGQVLAAESQNGTVELWRANPLLTSLIGHMDEVNSISWSPDGQLLASGSKDGNVRLWGSNGTPDKILQPNRGLNNSVSWNPDGQILASANYESIQLWTRDGQDFKSKILDHSINRGFPFPNPVQQVSWSSDGKFLASASFDTTVQLWDLNGNWQKTLNHDRWVHSVSWSSSGRIAFGALGGNIRIFKSDGTELKSFHGKGKDVYSVNWSPDGQTLASANKDGTVRLWDENGNFLQELKGHEDDVLSVNWSPDGKILASASADGTVKLWKQDGTLLITLKGHKKAVNEVNWNPDGKFLATASSDTTAKLWRLDLNLEDNEQLLDYLLVQNCNWMSEYFKTHPSETESDRHLCNRIGPQK